MGEESNTKIGDVEEIFDSFVKKKLLQLEMRRFATDGGSVNELKMSIKTKLEKNIPRNSVKDNNDDSSPKSKKRKGEKKHKKKKKKKDIWLEKEHVLLDKHKERESKTEKSHDKRELSKQEKKVKISKLKESSSLISDKLRNGESLAVDRMENFHTISKITENSKFDVTDKKILTENMDVRAENTSLDIGKNTSTRQEIDLKKTGIIKAEQDVSSSTAAVKSLPEKTNDAAEISDSTTAGPKNDAATIQIEFLKVKSEGEKVEQQVDVLLKKGQNDCATVKENRSLERNSDSKVREELKGRTSTRSLSHSKSRKHSNSHSRHRIRSRSRSRHRIHSSNRHQRSRSPSKRARHSARSWDRHGSKYSRRHSRSPLISKGDKVRLLEIAKANALAQHRAGLTANSVSSMGQIVKEGTMSVRELTDLCKDISTGIGNELISLEPPMKESAEKMIKESETDKIHHPFAVKDTAITFNIKQIKNVAIEEVLERVYGKWEVVAKDEATKKSVKELVSSDKVLPDPEQTNVSLSSEIAERI